MTMAVPVDRSRGPGAGDLTTPDISIFYELWIRLAPPSSTGMLAQGTRLEAFRFLLRHEPEGLPARGPVLTVAACKCLAMDLLGVKLL